MLREKKRIGGKNPLSEIEKGYIRKYHKTESVSQMVQVLKRTGKTIYDFLKEENLTPFVPRKTTIHHPWRRANRQLEQFVIDRQSK